MALKRKHPPTPCLSMQLDILFARKMVTCHFCGEPILSRKDVEWHHLHEWADGGTHTIDNIVPVHNKKSGRCHQKATSKAERDRSHIDRLEKEKLGLPKRKRYYRPLAKLPSLSSPRDQKPKPQKMKSRGFQSAYCRKINGTVVKREK